MVPVNYLAVLVAAIVMILIGGIWYGPLFGKRWMHLSGIGKEALDIQSPRALRSYLVMAICAFLMAYTLAHTLLFAEAYTNTSGIDAGVSAALWTWLGFAVPVSVGSIVWEHKPLMLWAINAGYYLVSLLFMGVLLASWS